MGTAPAGREVDGLQVGSKRRRVGGRIDQHEPAALRPEPSREMRGPARADIDAGDIDRPEPERRHRAGNEVDAALRCAGRAGRRETVARRVDGDDPAPPRQIGGD